MSKAPNPRDRIKEWLAAEALPFVESKNNFAEFQLVLANAFGLGLVIDVAKPKNRPIVAFAMQLVNPEGIQRGFAALSDKEKIKLSEGLKRELLKIGVDYNISEDMKVVTIIYYLYIEDMTRSLFMGSLKLVRNAALIIISTLSEKFTSGIASIPPHSHSEMISPYG